MSALHPTQLGRPLDCTYNQDHHVPVEKDISNSFSAVFPLNIGIDYFSLLSSILIRIIKELLTCCA